MPGSNPPPQPVSYNNNGGSGNGGNRQPYTPPNNPDRSANNNRPNPHGDPNAREQSKGFRPFLCSVVQKVQAAVEVVGEVVEVVLDVVEPIQDWMDPYQDRLYNAVKDTAVIQAIQQDARERPLEGILAAVVLDVVYDVASFALGHDLLSGEKLSHGEELFTAVAIAIPVVSLAAVKYGSRLLQGGKQIATHVDEVGDAAKFAVRHADELKDGTRVAAKHGDDLLERAAWSARHGDDLAESQTLTRRLDDYHSNNLVGNNSSSSNHNANSLSSSNGSLSQEDIYKNLENTPTGQYILDQIDQIGERPPIEYSNELLDYASEGKIIAAQYDPHTNKILLHPELQGLPNEFTTSIVGHELVHRISRKLRTGKSEEVLAHFVEAQIWREVNGANILKNLNANDLTHVQKLTFDSIQEISQIRTTDNMLEYVNKYYERLNDYSISHILRHQIARNNYEDLITRIPKLEPNIRPQIAAIDEEIKYWESLAD